MSSNRYLIDTEKGQIQAYRKQGLSIRDIGKKINRHKSTINQFLKNPDKYGQKKRSGRPQTVTKRDVRTILREASVGNSSAEKIKLNHDIPV